MELVYLWVEKYKNIEKQGFNFSPRFTCSYNETTNKLTIDEKKDYVSIFPENINVTAIVGENGSGKSSVLELLYEITNKSKKYSIIIIFFNKQFVISDKKKSRIFNNTSYNYILKNNIKKHKTSYINISHFQNEDIDIHDANYYSAYSDIMYRYEDNEQNNQSNILNRYKNLKTQINYFLIYQQEKLNYLKEIIKPQEISFIKVDFLKDVNMKDFFLDDKNDLKANELLYIIFSDKHPELFENDHVFDRNILTKFIDSYNVVNKKTIDKFISSCTLENNHFIVKYEDIDILKKLIDLENHDRYEYFELILLNKKRERLDLSSGEQLLLFYLIHIDASNTIIMIDEVDIYLHPQWQKEFISLLLKFSKDKHFILSSHSPFILSDLPKENIIFLEKGEQVYPFENKQTFGANIHTLLSHGFFMKDGLMGEFAKSKINEVIDNLHEKSYSLSQIQIKSIIKTIGEPFLQTKLEQMYNEKFGLIDELEDLQKEQAKINLKIEELKKRKSEDAKS